MSTAGPNAPGTMTDDAAVGTVAWSNPGNVATSNDVRAIASSGGATSHYLNCSNFGFAIPAGSTINGVTVSIERMSNRLTAVRYAIDSTVSLVKGGTVSGSNKADLVAKWPLTEAVATYGGASDLWGLTLTDSDVNASTFGVVLSAFVTHDIASTSGQVDFISITIDYTAGAAGVSIPVASQSYRQRRV